MFDGWGVLDGFSLLVVDRGKPGWITRLWTAMF